MTCKLSNKLALVYLIHTSQAPAAYLTDIVAQTATSHHDFDFGPAEVFDANSHCRHELNSDTERFRTLHRRPSETLP